MTAWPKPLPPAPLGSVSPPSIGTMNTKRFVDDICEKVCPALRPGQMLAMDNLSAHHAKAVRELVEAVGGRVEYLPLSSPDFSPIELAFSTLKAALKTAAARTQEALDAAIDQAVLTITAQDARGSFRQCGYPLAQSL